MLERLLQISKKEIPLIFSDRFYLLCIEEAKKSKSGFVKFGAVILSDDKEVIGVGHNQSIIHLQRVIKQGYANHAEIEALCDSIEKGINPAGGELFVAGFDVHTGQLIFKYPYTCSMCPKILLDRGISAISVPMPFGWIRKTLSQAIFEANEFKNRIGQGGVHQKRMAESLGGYKVEDIKI